MSQNNFNPTLRLIVYQKMSDALNEAYKCLNQHPEDEPAFRQDIEALSNLANNLLGYLCVAVLDQKEKVVDLDVEFPCSFLIETVNTIAGKKDMKDFLPLLAEARNDFAQNKLKAAEAVLSPEDQEELKRLTYAMKVAGILSPDEDSEEDEEDAEGESFLKALLSRVKGAIVIMGHSPDDDDDDDDDDEDDDEDDEEDNDEDNESED